MLIIRREVNCWCLLVACFLTSFGCSTVNTKVDAQLLEGPPIRSITTPYDRALMCLDGKIERQFTFAVGAILDRTGREQFTNGGQGKYVIQGAGDIVQSALFKTGVTLLNRQDPRVMETDFKWGLRKPTSVVPVDFFVTGSINSLDFLPGGGADISVDGVGPSYMSNRILVGLDLSVTQAKTGRILAAVSLQKQISTKEFNLGIGRFFGGSLVSLSAGVGRRETLQFVQRQMLNLAIFELLSQLLTPTKYEACVDEVAVLGSLDTNLRSIRELLAYREARARSAQETARSDLNTNKDRLEPAQSPESGERSVMRKQSTSAFDEASVSAQTEAVLTGDSQEKKRELSLRDSEDDGASTEEIPFEENSEVERITEESPGQEASPSVKPWSEPKDSQRRKDQILRY